MSSSTHSSLPTGTWTSDHTHSHAGFAIRAVGTFRGSFETLAAALTVVEDGDALLTGCVVADSIHVKNEQQKTHLLSPDFFDAAHYPELRFVSRSFNQDGERVRLEGELTIKGHTQAVTADGTMSGPVTALDGAVRLGLSFETIINRTDFGVSWNVPLPTGRKVLGEEVTITVDLDLVLVTPEAT